MRTRPWRRDRRYPPRLFRDRFDARARAPGRNDLRARRPRRRGGGAGARPRASRRRTGIGGGETSSRRRAAAARRRTARRRTAMSAHVHDITITVNDEVVRQRVDARKTLVDFLREDLALTGSHVGCEHGVCGACSVRVGGAVVRGCLMLAVQCDGKRVDTIEGIADSGEIADLQRAFIERNALQCGYCTPGMLLTAQELLQGGGLPSRQKIRAYLSGNYCRCTGYHAIVDAIEAVAQARAGNS